MKARYGVGLVFAVGLCAGAGGLEGLEAATASAPAYVIANIRSVQDAESFKKYQTAVGAMQAPFGGKLIARSKAIALDRSTLPAGRVIVIAFPSLKNLQAWWNSAAYSAIRPIRENTTKSTDYAVEGLPPS